MNLFEHYLKEYDKFKSHVPRTQHFLSLEKRQSAFEKFCKKGFPNSKEEAWAGIARSPLLQTPFYVVLSSKDLFESKKLPKLCEPSAIRLVFINGHFSKVLSSDLNHLPKGLQVQTLSDDSQVLDQDIKDHELLQDTGELNPFSAMNYAFSQEYVGITIADNHNIEPLIELCFIGESIAQLPMLVATRYKIKVGKNSRVRFLERYSFSSNNMTLSQTAAFFMNVMTELSVQEAAEVVWAQNIQAEQGYVHVGELNISQEANSHLALECLIKGGSLVRHTLPIYLNGKGALAQAQALTVAKENHNIDHHIIVNHQASGTNSLVDYRAIADDQSRVGFRGEVYAISDAIQIQAKQNSRNLLLSNRATIDTQPRLELFTEDLICTHGATIGSLDEAALFYLQSRGISKIKARSLLIEAFSQAILDKMSILSGNAF